MLMMLLLLLLLLPSSIPTLLHRLAAPLSRQTPASFLCKTCLLGAGSHSHPSPLVAALVPLASAERIAFQCHARGLVWVGLPSQGSSKEKGMASTATSSLSSLCVRRERAGGCVSGRCSRRVRGSREGGRGGRSLWQHDDTEADRSFARRPGLTWLCVICFVGDAHTSCPARRQAGWLDVCGAVGEDKSLSRPSTASYFQNLPFLSKLTHFPF